jgi:8-oxo-dGTP pyrophosphatase MutT (NUDIX family)
VHAPKDAATVVLLRARGEETEVFLVRRHGQSAFMGGAYVFPGGKLDGADRELASFVRDPSFAERLEPTPGRSLSVEDAIGLHAAACRELFEEAGVLIADGAAGAEWRTRLQSGEATLAEMCRAEGLIPRLERLTYFAHWVTPSLEQRRYDTRFFLVELPPDQTPIHDDRETTEEAWLTPGEALAMHEKREIFLPPPTQRTLEELGPGAPHEIIARAGERTIAAILPKVSVLDGRFTILLPWDPDYETTEGESLDVPSPHPNASLPSRIAVPV